MLEYTQDITTIHQVLDRDTQRDLFAKMKDGDRDAKDRVIYSCLPLVVDIAKKFRVNNKHVDLEDMVQEGNIALMKAVEKWDVERGSITTVATWYIRNVLIDMIHDASYKINSSMTLSRRASEEISKIRRVGSSNVKEICNKTNLSEKRVKKLLSLSSCKRVNGAKAEQWMSELSIADDNLDNDGEVFDVDAKRCVADIISLANSNLSSQQRKIFYMWSGIGYKKIGAKQISQDLKLTVIETMKMISSSKTILKKAAKVRQNA
mgnify:FL=1